MDKTTIYIILTITKYLFLIGICVIFFIILQKIGKKAKGVNINNEIDNMIKERKLLSPYKKKMSKLGIMYRAGNYDLNPSWYITARISVGFIFFLIGAGLIENIVLGIIGLFAGYFLTALYFKKQNNNDNKEIMMHIYNTYATIKIQMQSGLYIANALEYSYKSAQNKRYKEALGELVINLSDKTIQMSQAIDKFRDRFDSKEINKLCMLLQNLVLYGAQEGYVKDIMHEVQNIVLANTLEVEHNIETKTGLITFAFFTMIIFITLYSIITNFSGFNLFI